MSAEIQVRVNGKSYESHVEPRLLLVHYLRDALGLTARTSDAKRRFAERVRVARRKAVKSARCWPCRHPARKSQPSKASPLWLPRMAMVCIRAGRILGKHGLQCGFCTPG